MGDAVAMAALFGAMVAVVGLMVWLAVTLLTQPIGHAIIAGGLFGAGYVVGVGVSWWGNR